MYMCVCVSVFCFLDTVLYLSRGRTLHPNSYKTGEELQKDVKGVVHV